MIAAKRGGGVGARSMVAAALLGLVTVACGADGRSATPSDRPVVRLVTYSSFVLDPEVERSVEQRLGADLEISASGDSGEALARAILNAGSPEGDVFFGVDNTLLSRALASDVFEEPRDLTGVVRPEWSRTDASALVVAIQSGAVCVDYDRGWFEARQLAPPETLADLVDPRLRDLLVLPSPATSSPGLVFLSAVQTTVADPAAYWARLKDNGVAIVGSWDDAWFERYTVNGGDRPVVISYASSPPAEVFFSEGAVTEPSTSVALATCAAQTEYAAVLRGTEQPQLAARLLAEMTGPDWQTALPLSNFVEPLRPGTERPDLFERFAPVPSSPIELDPAVVGAERDNWVQQWRDILE